MAGTRLSAKERARLGEWLGRYVYVLVDPFNGVPFYVGRGVGARVTQHGLDAARWSDVDDRPGASAKIRKINEIRKKGDEPEILIARRQVQSDRECAAIEAALIDVLRTFPVSPTSTVTPLIGSTQLTNIVRGEGIENGLEALAALVQELTAPPLETTTPLLVISLKPWTDQIQEVPGGGTRRGHGWKGEWAQNLDLDELGDVVRCWWSGLNESNTQRRGVHHVVGTYRGITRGLFEIVEGSWAYHNDRGSSRPRGGFAVRPVESGALWDEVIGDKCHRLPEKRRGEQSAYRYWPYD